jgi:hypothetical protein
MMQMPRIASIRLKLEEGRGILALLHNIRHRWVEEVGEFATR